MNKIENFSKKKIHQNDFFSKISLKSKFFENFDQNRNNSKFSKKSNLLEILTKFAIFRKFDQIEFFFEILTKIKFFERFDQNRKFSKF